MEDLFHETLRQSTAAFNAVCRYGWFHHEHNGVNLHHATYTPLRKEFEELPSQLIVSARMKAAEALKSVEELKQQGRKVSCPHSDLCPIRYDHRSYWVILDQGVASLATVDGRVGVGFHLPRCYDRYLSWKTCSADLIFNARKKRFYLHVVVSTDAPEVEPDGNVVGCGLGIRRIAVTSKPRFFSSAALHTRVRQHQKLRSELQAKGTQNAKRHLQKSSRRWKRFQADVNHGIANEILASMKAGDVLVLEDLTGIRESCRCRRKHRGRFHRWSFAQLAQFLCYKAERKGILVVRVDPRNSSRTCCKCGHCEKSNRRSQSRFRCLSCGYCVNADFNAAQVLRQWGTASLARVTSDTQSQPSCHSSSIAQAVEKLPTIECSLEQQRAASYQALAGSH